mmetsp:Transcript_34798/g.78651  ORF Transcript_34798/g.78651 Transcript_34798/m.78651 type:complete len:361 (-) Transcript_34798:428-1510(-)
MTFPCGSLGSTTSSEGFLADAVRASRSFEEAVLAGGGTYAAMLPVRGGTNSFFRETRLPRSMTPVEVTGPLKASFARATSGASHMSKLERISTMFTTARNRKSTPFSAFPRTSSGKSSAFRSIITASSVVSTTAKPILNSLSADPLSLKTLQSPLQSWVAERPTSSLLLALNCSDAKRLMSSTPAMMARMATMALSHWVVVGPLRFSVSLMIADRSMPAIAGGGLRPDAMYPWVIIVLMDPQGRMSMKMGISVTMVSLWRAWWSMTPTMRLAGIAGFSCEVCWWSTRHTPASGCCSSISSMGGGFSHPHRSRHQAVSLFTSEARHARPLYKSAAPMAPAMESMSVTRWPQKSAPLSIDGT